MDEQTSKRLYRSLISGSLSKQEYEQVVRGGHSSQLGSKPMFGSRSTNNSSQYVTKATAGRTPSGQSAFVTVRQPNGAYGSYVPARSAYGSGPCGPCGPCEPCPCPNVCITNYGADLPFINPNIETLINLNTDYTRTFYAVSSSPTCFMMAFSVPSQVRLNDNTVGVLRRLDPPYSNQFGNAYIHPYDGYSTLPMEQISLISNAIGPCQQGLQVINVTTPQVVPPLGLSNSTGVGQQSYLLPMQVNPCLLQTPVEQLTNVQRVILGIDLTCQTTFGECRIGPNSCRTIGQFVHSHTRGQNDNSGQYGNNQGLFTVLAFDVMCITLDTNVHDEVNAPTFNYVNTLWSTPEAAYPIYTPFVFEQSINFLNGTYFETDFPAPTSLRVGPDPTIVAKNARHQIIWTQNMACMYPDPVEQFKEFCIWYEAKFNDVPFDDPNFSFPYSFIPKGRRIEQLLRSQGQYKAILIAIAFSVMPPPVLRSVRIDPPPQVQNETVPTDAPLTNSIHVKDVSTYPRYSR